MLVEPAAQWPEAIGIDSVDARRALRFVDHEPGVLQHFEVLRHRRATDRKTRGEGADAARMFRDPFEHRAAGRVGEGGEGSVVHKRGVSKHLR